MENENKPIYNQAIEHYGVNLQIDIAIEEMSEAYKEFANAINQFNFSLLNFAKAYISYINDIVTDAKKAAIAADYPNKRVIYLALRAKKKRIRNKNIKRIKKFFYKIIGNIHDNPELLEES